MNSLLLLQALLAAGTGLLLHLAPCVLPAVPLALLQWRRGVLFQSQTLLIALNALLAVLAVLNQPAFAQRAGDAAWQARASRIRDSYPGHR